MNDKKHGYAVLAIPSDGLFVRNGHLETGSGKNVSTGEVIIFSQRLDADRHADRNAVYWATKGGGWNFHVIPVLMSERP